LSATARNSSAKRTLLFAISLVIPALVLCLLWHAAGPLEKEVVVNDPLRPSLNITSCQTGTVGYPIMIILIVYIASLLVYTLYLAYRVRNVYVEFNETRQLATAIYIFTFTSVIILLLEAAAAVSSLNSRFALRGFGIALAFTAFAFIVFVPKIVVVILSISYAFCAALAPHHIMPMIMIMMTIVNNDERRSQ
jgi:phosphatidylglycerophosphate synthase